MDTLRVPGHGWSGIPLRSKLSKMTKNPNFGKQLLTLSNIRRFETMKLTKLIIPLITITVLVFSISIVAAEDKALGDETVDFLFVQYAKSATLANGKLTLRGIQPETLYFSDRPDRVVGRESTKKFVEYWWKEGRPSSSLTDFRRYVGLILSTS